MMKFTISVLVGLAVFAAGWRPAYAQPVLPKALQSVGFDQHLNDQVPLDLHFLDEEGRPVTLGEYFTDKPVVLILAYYQCPMLCNQVHMGLVQGLRDTRFTIGKDFNVVTVSFDPQDTPDKAAEKKQAYLRLYNQPQAELNWHFLTGKQSAITSLTNAVGFRYHFDAASGQFAHAAGIVILTPDGKISRYLYDVHFPARDLRLALVEASENKIGSPTDQVLLFCFHYDPLAGRYGAAIMNLVRAGGGVTMVVLLALVWRLRRGEQKRRHYARTSAEAPAPRFEESEKAP